MKMVCIEGIDAVGKESVSKALEKHLCTKGFRVKRVSFPIYEAPAGRLIKEVLMGCCGDAPKLDKELFGPLYTIDRLSYFKANMKHLFDNYDYLILDRSFYSNFMYQASKIYINDFKYYSNDSISVELYNWMCKNNQWEIYDTGLNYCESIMTFVLTLSEEDSLKQLENRSVKDTNEKNRGYLNECKKFITHMMSDGVRNSATKLCEIESENDKCRSAMDNYILNVHPIEVTHADNPEDIAKCVNATAETIMGYLFNDSKDDDDVDDYSSDDEYTEVEGLDKEMMKYSTSFITIGSYMTKMYQNIKNYISNFKYFDFSDSIYLQKAFKGIKWEFDFNNTKNPLSISVIFSGRTCSHYYWKDVYTKIDNKFVIPVEKSDWFSIIDNKFPNAMIFDYDGISFTVKEIKENENDKN